MFSAAIFLLSEKASNKVGAKRRLYCSASERESNKFDPSERFFAI